MDDSKFNEVIIKIIPVHVVKLLKSPNSDFVRSLVKIGVVKNPMLFVIILQRVNHIPDLITVNEVFLFILFLFRRNTISALYISNL